ncbi:unnamed protein product, partial [Symbiodinium necroappetens]
VSFLRKYVTVDMLKSQLDELAGSDPVISSRIEDQFSLLFPTEASAARPIPADAFQGTARRCRVHRPGLTQTLLIPPARTQGILQIRLSLLQASDLT